MLFLKNLPLSENLPAHIPEGEDLVTKERKSRITVITVSRAAWMLKHPTLLWLSAKENYRNLAESHNLMPNRSKVNYKAVLQRCGSWNGSGCKVLVKSVRWFFTGGVVYKTKWKKCRKQPEIAFQVIGAIHLLHNFQSHEYFTSLRLLVNVAQPVVNYLEQDVTF